jgi:CelD/BcsL family acetyltransferase involved in cellulose biosynthesis
MMAATPLRSFQDIQAEWEGLLSLSSVNTLFLTPQWQEVWWDTFGNGRGMASFYIRQPEGITGIASLSRQDHTMSLMGNTETFDYNDIMVRPGYESDFFEALLRCLEDEGCDTLELYSLVESSPTLRHLPELARQRGYDVDVSEEDVTPGLELPDSWDQYLAGLTKKNRHELRRKFRRLEAVGNWSWYHVSDADEVALRMDDFFKLMAQSDPEKAMYMTSQREQFFRSVTRRTADLGLLKLFFLEMDGQPVATSLCFDYDASRLLYNSGYNPDFSYYSVGLLLNALCLRDAIERGAHYFDFLRGPEPYKYHLGGHDHILYQMVVRRS